MRDVTEIFSRYVQNKCSKEEVELLILYFHSNKALLLSNLIYKELDNNIASSDDEEIRIQSSIRRVEDRLMKSILPNFINAVRKNKSNNKNWIKVSITATIVIIALLKILFIANKITKNTEHMAGIKKQHNIILPD
jgi:transmembrane sensor